MEYDQCLRYKLLQNFKQLINFRDSFSCYINYDDYNWVCDQFRINFIKNDTSLNYINNCSNSLGSYYFLFIIHAKFLDVYFHLWNTFQYRWRNRIYDPYFWMQQIFGWEKNVCQWFHFDWNRPWICSFWIVCFLLSQSW